MDNSEERINDKSQEMKMNKEPSSFLDISSNAHSKIFKLIYFLIY